MAHKQGLFGLNPDYDGEDMGTEHMGRRIVCMTEPDLKVGLCLHPALSSDYLDGWLNRTGETDLVDGAVARSDDDRGSLAVGEDFGCIHFQPA